MQSFAALSVLVALVANAAALTISTPASIVQCEPVQFSWDSDNTGVPPYFLSILPGGDSTAAALKTFPQTSATTYTWIADIAADTSITAALRDNTGNQVFTSQVTIQSSSNSSCVNNVVAEGGASTDSGASSGSTPATGGSSTTPSGSTVSSSGGSTGSSTSSIKTTSSVKSTGTSSGSSSSPSTTGTSNSASRGSSLSAFGIAGVMGMIGAALL